MSTLVTNPVWKEIAVMAGTEKHHGSIERNRSFRFSSSCTIEWRRRSKTTGSIADDTPENRMSLIREPLLFAIGTKAKQESHDENPSEVIRK
ncbi:MAG: hypothetical protein QGH42_08730 [Kiritimatiellia bacterium]|jgi:hypothetical protein|nr:hypothetical protein [Kiritimatiellia bacterium]MDP6809918.1 hypothetical protein [Kiritimatiellia bacterium]MDP7024310.1 hypothetical protein [Kiritimatiellia bacterium]